MRFRSKAIAFLSLPAILGGMTRVAACLTEIDCRAVVFYVLIFVLAFSVPFSVSWPRCVL